MTTVSQENLSLPADASDLEHAAAVFANEAHADQLRKYTNEPYIRHPEAVAAIVRTVTDDPDMLAAAWLHDTVEDCGVTIAEIESRFGVAVGALVEMVTDVSTPEDGNRAARKAIDCAHIARGNASAKTIKLADLIDNTKSIVAHDPKFAKVYLREKAVLLGVLRDGDTELWRQAAAQVWGWSTSEQWADADGKAFEIGATYRIESGNQFECIGLPDQMASLNEPLMRRVPDGMVHNACEFLTFRNGWAFFDLRKVA